ncbi:MAG: hypothetical protein HPY74_09695 [Firmicutes bacterium]|nr:hypothetical protein [Bacillota bacterium]
MEDGWWTVFANHHLREKRKYLEEKPEYLKEILQYGSEKARTEGAKTLEKVKEAMSIRYF